MKTSRRRLDVDVEELDRVIDAAENGPLSKADRQVALFLDGALIKNWIDPNGFAGQGTGVRFVNNSSPGGAVKISNLRVSKWNGVLDDASAEIPDPSHDVVLLDSGAKISGAVASIADGRISLLTSGGV